MIMVFEIYETRVTAGEILAELINKEDKELYNHIIKSPKTFFCYSIPNGGVPVSEGFCSKLNINYDMLIVRKIKIPWNTEAGFGSITTDGTILINEPLLSRLNLSDQDFQKSINVTKNEIRERLKLYDKETHLEENYKTKIQDNHIFIMDDGLASGFTMLAAIKMIKKYNPKKLFIAIPTAPLRTIQEIEPKVEKIYCPNIRDVWRFAVADAYKNWYDVPESEVIEIIKNSQFFSK